jgi:hypothetical protein
LSPQWTTWWCRRLGGPHRYRRAEFRPAEALARTRGRLRRLGRGPLGGRDRVPVLRRGPATDVYQNR